MKRLIKPILLYLILLSCLGSLLLVCSRVVDKKAASQNQIKAVEKKEKTVAMVDRYLSQMTLEEKIGQLFFSRVPEEGQLEALETYHLGGYVLFSRDMEDQTLDSLAETLTGYQAASRIPLLVASDEEGGWVTRISDLLEVPFASPMDLYQTGGLETVLEDTREKARLLRSLGIHTGLYPVADLAEDPDSFIYDRTLGEDLETTSHYISELVKVMGQERFGSTLKHFPGYGDNGDSHTDIIYDERSLAELQRRDLIPFAAGVAAGADSVLVSHNIVTALEEVPASISPEVTRLLRQDLGFEGVIMTDDLDMAGLAEFMSQEEAAFAVLIAGNDMIMSSIYESQIPYLLDKVASGELTEDRLDQSVRRILTWKEKLGLLN